MFGQIRKNGNFSLYLKEHEDSLNVSGARDARARVGICMKVTDLTVATLSNETTEIKMDANLHRRRSE